MEWTRELRYKKYSDWDALSLLKLEAAADKSDYQMKYHIRPQSGLLNDPNGFSYYNGRYHVFYQSFPFGAAHGLKSWHHMASSDLVRWEDLGLAVLPDTKYDSHGAYSGSALPVDGKLLLMYTGNHREPDWTRIPYQVGAYMDEHNQVAKLKKPMIDQPDHVTEHFRDPQLIKDKGDYFVLLGAQDKDTKSGQISVWRSHDLKDWKDLGYLDFSSHEMGYMIECPNLVYVNDQPVLIFCPQGLDKQVSSYENIYPNMYLVGNEVRLNGPHFRSDDDRPLNLDDGFDVYATQAFNAPNGKAYAISWVGLPDIAYPTDDEGWANCLSQVKELEIRDGQLYQHPVLAMASLRQEGTLLRPERRVNDRQQLLDDSGRQYEIKLDIRANQQGSLHLAADKNLDHSVRLDFDTAAGKLTVDRKTAGMPVAEKYGTPRSIDLPAGRDLKLDIFVDGSLCEIFVNDGRHVMTLRFFAPVDHQTVAFSAEKPVDFTGTYWPLAK